MTDPKTLRETLKGWASSENKVSITLFLVGPREISGELQAVTSDTVVIGSASKPYYVALEHIVWVQEQ